jgi:F0F1-type ATP synthase assembly protein I
MKAQAYRLLKVQLLITIFYPAFITALDWGDAISALTGCLFSLLPSTYFSLRMLRQMDNLDAVSWLRSAYSFEIGKWVMAGLLFALAFSSGYRWDPIVLFAGYLLTQMSGIFSPSSVKGK